MMMTMLEIDENSNAREYKEPYATIDCETEEDFNRLKKAFEKSVLVKPYKVCIVEYECPKCHKRLCIDYPCKCGQMIDWSDTDD